MKKELTYNLELQELSMDEMMETDGGGPALVIGLIVAAAIVVFCPTELH